MHGRRLPELVEHYRRLEAEQGLAVLCVQENRTEDDRCHSEHIATGLGAHYAELSEPGMCGKGMIYDRDRLEVVDHRMIKLPRLERLSWVERRYIAGGVPDQRYLQVARFASEQGEVVIANFHLDTAGGNGHRRVQVEAIADHLADEGAAVVVCGDTNAFSLRQHSRLLRWLLEPLTDSGIAIDTDGEPTHFFSRQREPMLAHRMTVLAGKLGIDFPRRYDVVGSSACIAAHGLLQTPESDHDLVWARLGRE